MHAIGLKPYNEMAMMIPVMAHPAVNLPVLPMVTPFFGNFGYYAVGILVTSKENALRGAIWGLRKTLGEATRKCGRTLVGPHASGTRWLCPNELSEKDLTDVSKLHTPPTG